MTCRAMAGPDLSRRRPGKDSGARDLADLAARGIERVHLCGHSMGGAVAALMALAEPGPHRLADASGAGRLRRGDQRPAVRRFAAATAADEIRHCHAAMSAPDARLSRAHGDVLRRCVARPGQNQTAGPDRRSNHPRRSSGRHSARQARRACHARLGRLGDGGPCPALQPGRRTCRRLCPARGGGCRPHAGRGSAGPGDANHRARHTLTRRQQTAANSARQSWRPLGARFRAIARLDSQCELVC